MAILESFFINLVWFVAISGTTVGALYLCLMLTYRGSIKEMDHKCKGFRMEYYPGRLLFPGIIAILYLIAYYNR